MMERNLGGVKSVVVWVAIIVNHRTGPAIFQNVDREPINGMNADCYISQVLASYWAVFSASLVLYRNCQSEQICHFDFSRNCHAF